MTQSSSMLMNAALRYAELGYPVFPCAPGDKVPLCQHGFHNATVDPDQIERWWSQHPNANIGIPTQELLVVDIDGQGNAWLADVPERMLELAVAPLSITPRGGSHRLFRQPVGKNWRCTEGKLAPKVDTRADGGYIVVPPSVIAGGRAYRWAEGLALDDPPDILPEPPPWLVEELDRIATGLPGIAHVATGDGESNQIPSGQRNATLARLGGTMRRVGMSQSEIVAALMQANADRCAPPLEPREVERIAASVARYQPDEVSVALAENHWEQMYSPPTDAPTQRADPGPLPEELLHVPGFISEVMDFTMTNAPYPNVGLAFCGAMALQSFLAGRKVCTPGDLRPNLYLLALASSGTGKDFPRKVNSRVLYEVGLVGAIGDKFASGEGIQDALVRNNAMLFQNDEMDGVLRQINLDRENRRESIPNILLTLYTSANDVYPIRVKAGQKETIHIDQPHLTLFGTATPQYFYESLCQRMLTNGFFARMIVIDVGRRGAGQTPGSARALSDSIVETARWWAEYKPTPGNLQDAHPEPRVVPFTPEASAAIAQLQRMTETEYDRAEEAKDEVARTAWSRTCENATKLALIYACSENHEEPVIGLPAVEWATTFAMHQTRRQLFLAATYVAENPFHAECLKLLRRLRESPDGQMQRQHLLRAMRCKAADFDQIVGTLVQQGDIAPVQIPTKTKPAQGYRLA